MNEGARTDWEKIAQDMRKGNEAVAAEAVDLVQQEKDAREAADKKKKS